MNLREISGMPLWYEELKGNFYSGRWHQRKGSLVLGGEGDGRGIPMSAEVGFGCFPRKTRVKVS